MNNKITLLELASSLSQHKNVPKKTAEAFVRHLFDVVQEYVVRDGQVKIKGFGTFKLVDVESRESVNVNTGERVVIEGHAKITFTPEASLRDQVNKPFADFSTVILNPTTSVEEMESIDVEYQGDEEIEDSSETTIESTTDQMVQDGSQTLNEEVGQNAEELVEESTEEFEEELVEEHTEDPEDKLIEETWEPNEDFSAQTTQLASDELPSAEQTAVNHIEHQTIEQMTVGSQFVGQQTIQQMVSNAVREELKSHNELVLNKGLQLLLVVLILVLFACFYFVGYHFGSRANQFAQVKSPMELQVEEKTAVDSATQEIAKNNAPVIEKQESPRVKEVAKPTAKSDTSTPKKQSNSNAKDLQQRASKYEQLPNGEYLIVGTKGVHIMARGDNMYKIARQTYGNSKLADYIIFYNKFPNPDKVFLGTKIQLPELVKK